VRIGARLLSVVVAAGIATRGLPTRADEGSDARAHYEAAQQLYDEGRYEQAIDEFELAYRKKPHSNVLYNIGQAYERLLDYGASVGAFERFLAEAAADDPRRKIVENRLRVLKVLPARVSVTSNPEHVRVTLRDRAGQVVKEGESPHVFSIPEGDYELELAQPGWEAERHSIRVDIGQPYFYQYRLERSMVEALVESDPSGARVFIDERLVGETPFHGRLEVGRHGLLLEYPEYPWHREVITAEAGRPIKRKLRLERPPRSGRTELVLGAMAFGGVVGPLLVGAISGSTQFTESGQGVATLLLSSVAGIGAGFAGAFFTTRNGISVGTSSLLIGGGGFGSGAGAALALGLRVDERSIYGITLLGGAVGVTAAALAAHFGEISAGDAALVNSGGLWGTASAAVLAQALPWDGGRPSAAVTGWFVLGGTVLGITVGVLSARFLDRTRTELAIIDLGGLVGTGLGFALGYAVGKNAGTTDDGITQGARFGLGGMVLGLVAGGFVGRSWGKRLQRKAKPGQAQLDAPALRLDPVRLPEGEGMRISLDVLRGRW